MLLVKSLHKIDTWTVLWGEGSGSKGGMRWNYFLLEEYPINVTILGMWTKTSLAVPFYYWMWVQNNYLLAKIYMTGHWHCRLIEFVLRASRPYRGLFNFAWGGQPITRDESRRHLLWLPTKTIIAALSGHQQRVDRQHNTDLDYLGDKIQFTLLEAIGPRAISPGNRPTDLECAGINSNGETQLIAYAGADDLWPYKILTDWLDQ